MWTNIGLSKYSHSRVTTFSQHLKHNNDLTKLMFQEEHIPKHMRLNFLQRLIRFMFVPLCMAACVGIMHWESIYKEVVDLCFQRQACFARCLADNFPKLNCVPDNTEIEYRGNLYRDFFFFPYSDSQFYSSCFETLSDNAFYAESQQNKTRQLAVHTCFPACRRPADCLLGFDMDTRPMCDSNNQDQGILCVDPDKVPCDNFVRYDQYCIDEEKRICLNWKFILIAIGICNTLQVIFEGAMLYAFETTLRPSYLDKLQSPEELDEDTAEQQSTDNKKELDCTKVMNKCWGELIFISIYVANVIFLFITWFYQINYGKPLSLVVEWSICMAIDQFKSFPAQVIIYWIVIRRCGKLSVSPDFNSKWDDEIIFAGGIELSLLSLLRRKVADFLEHKIIENLILGMTIFLCIVIFSELALDIYIEKIQTVGNFFYYLNLFLLTFFVCEIISKTFAYGLNFFYEFINLFDSVIVIISFVMLILDLKLKILGLLRVLRLIKVISGMKKVVDEKRERQEAIKQQKKQSQTMSSYVERVLDFMERMCANPEVPKHLQEDFQWAIDIISANKLYAGSMQGFRLQEDRLEVKAWTDMIAMRSIPINKKEVERLRAFEVQKEEEANQRKKRLSKGMSQKPGAPSKMDTGGSRMGVGGGLSGGQKPGMGFQGGFGDEDRDEEFLQMIDLADMDQEHLELAIDKLEMTTFDAFHFEQILSENSLQYLTYKILQQHKLLDYSNISLESLVAFIREIAAGYFKENAFHNQVHILDSLQGLHYMLKAGNIKKYLKKHDMLAVITACLIHDFEHPGYSNQFVIRTKHPLAIRYSDQSVLENHHLAAAFQVLYCMPKCNFIENMPLDLQKETRRLIIDSVLNTDISKHFSLLTVLKTKLGNNFPTESIEDRTLILSVSLRVAGSFKVVRERSTFFKWMENMFEEFFKQGDMEKVLELPISKFMDRENTNKEKAFSNYLNVVCRPLFVTYLILVNEQDISDQIFKEGIDKNKKNLETRIDDAGKS